MPSEESVLRLFAEIMKEAPEALPGLANVASHLFSGDAEGAAREARLTAETIGIKKLTRKAYDT